MMMKSMLPLASMLGLWEFDAGSKSCMYRSVTQFDPTIHDKTQRRGPTEHFPIVLTHMER
eukprot:3696428-Prymnesium_polylepis.1